jgi:hypothetical protein
MTRTFDGKTSPLFYVISKNLHRRHLTESQRATVASKVATFREGRPSKTAQVCAVSQDEAAKQLNVSRRTIQKAVEAGDISVTAAEIAQPPEATGRKGLQIERDNPDMTVTSMRKFAQAPRSKPQNG